jgi:hypothetical protein
MKKALITFVILFCISLFTTFVSFLVCGGELIKTGIAYGIEQYREHQATENMNNIDDMIQTT